MLLVNWTIQSVRDSRVFFGRPRLGGCGMGRLSSVRVARLPHERVPGLPPLCQTLCRYSAFVNVTNTSAPLPLLSLEYSQS